MTFLDCINFNRNDAWVWLKEFIENQEEKTFILNIDNFNL